MRSITQTADHLPRRAANCELASLSTLPDGAKVLSEDVIPGFKPGLCGFAQIYFVAFVTPEHQIIGITQLKQIKVRLKGIRKCRKQESVLFACSFTENTRKVRHACYIYYYLILNYFAKSYY